MEATLFHEEREDIKIDIVARFEGDVLVIDGFDIGKTVKDYWGSSDYEYNMRIHPTGVAILAGHLGVAPEEKERILSALASQYNTNSCFSELEKLVDRLKIPHESFKWR
ncbi:MAG: hypothetical protein JNK10_05140 [Cyclobacteriaceae bacterium]|nr:hypothetical protein [Cyclobacteriaceae bacterium]